MRSADLDHLFKRIEESSVAVVIFSDWYTESKWCLDELAKINERVIERKIKVIPIFYKVNVYNVKKLEGKFGKKFREMKMRCRGEGKRIRNWEKALRSTPRKFGLISSHYRTQYDLVSKIVVEVKNLLNQIPKEGAETTKANGNRKVYNSQIPRNNTNFGIAQIREMLIQRSIKITRTEDRENVPWTSLKWNKRKRKKNDEIDFELEDKWKPEDNAQPIGEPIKVTGEAEDKKCHYGKFKFAGKQYGLEDSVQIIPLVPSRKLYVAIIKDIYPQGDEDYVYLEVQWFYRLEEAVKKDGRNWESRDSRVLFYSFHRDEVFAEFVRQECAVHFLPGNKQIPKPRHHPGFIVQNVYDFVNKKLWELNDEDFEEKQKHEIDLLVAKTVSRLGDLPIIENGQKNNHIRMK